MSNKPFKYHKCSSADVDLVVHAAGPFQQAKNCNVLEAAIETKVRKGNYVKFSFLLFIYFISLIYVMILVLLQL